MTLIPSRAVAAVLLILPSLSWSQRFTFNFDEAMPFVVNSYGTRFLQEKPKCTPAGSRTVCTVSSKVNGAHGAEAIIAAQLNCIFDSQIVADFRRLRGCTCQAMVTNATGSTQPCACTLCPVGYGNNPISIDCSAQVQGAINRTYAPGVWTGVNATLPPNGTLFNNSFPAGGGPPQDTGNATSGNTTGGGGTVDTSGNTTGSNGTVDTSGNATGSGGTIDTSGNTSGTTDNTTTTISTDNSTTTNASGTTIDNATAPAARHLQAADNITAMVNATLGNVTANVTASPPQDFFIVDGCTSFDCGFQCNGSCSFGCENPEPKCYSMCGTPKPTPSPATTKSSGAVMPALLQIATLLTAATIMIPVFFF